MVFEKVKSIIVDQLDVDAEKITLDSKVAEDLGADSLDVVDLIMSIEEEFDMEIDDDAVEKMKTVGDIIAFIDSNNK